jgi:hypothetical protein
MNFIVSDAKSVQSTVFADLRMFFIATTLIPRVPHTLAMIFIVSAAKSVQSTVFADFKDVFHRYDADSTRSPHFSDEFHRLGR